MKRVWILLLPFVIVGCAGENFSESFVADVWEGRKSPDDICRYISPDYSITAFQKDPRAQEESCQSVVDALQSNSENTKGTAAAFISPGQTVGLICVRNPFASKAGEELAIIPVLLREEAGKIEEIHISPHISFQGKSNWQETRGIQRAAERARASLPSQCRELEVFEKTSAE